MPKYQVIVGNLGFVHECEDKAEARGIYLEYIRQSELPYGRAAGESIILMEDGEPIEERIGTAF